MKSAEPKRKRWLKALELAKILFDDEVYFVDYLVEIKEWVKNSDGIAGAATSTKNGGQDEERHPDSLS